LSSEGRPYDATFKPGTYTLDTSTGTDTLRISSAVPEPSTWAMMLAGFGALGFVGYRRNQAAKLAA
jgi:hypothetical protein